MESKNFKVVVGREERRGDGHERNQRCHFGMDGRRREREREREREEECVQSWVGKEQKNERPNEGTGRDKRKVNFNGGETRFAFGRKRRRRKDSDVGERGKLLSRWTLRWTGFVY